MLTEYFNIKWINVGQWNDLVVEIPSRIFWERVGWNFAVLFSLLEFLSDSLFESLNIWDKEILKLFFYLKELNARKSQKIQMNYDSMDNSFKYNSFVLLIIFWLLKIKLFFPSSTDDLLFDE